MKKSTKITLIFLAIILAISSLWFGLTRPKFLTNHDYLYSTAVQYLLDHDTDPYRNTLKDYHRFADYQGFGITEDNQYYYAYLWILDEAYYVDKNDHLRAYTGGSMPYKFRFDKQTSAVIDYEIPEDGTSYAPSIRKMFPSSIARKVLSTSGIDTTKITAEVKEHYNYLSDTEIYYSDSKN